MSNKVFTLKNTEDLSNTIKDLFLPSDSGATVVFLSGDLGAGKTTFVNYILKEQNQWKICVLENEFGEVSIDDGLGTCQAY